MNLILVRHGETDANREGKLMSGSGGPCLNATGRAQATDIAAALKGELPFHLYTSPAWRARETTEIISRALNAPFTIVDDLAETDVGDFEDLTVPEMRQKYRSYVGEWERDAATARPPGGETIQELQDRAWCAVQRLSAAHADETVVAVSHCFTILTVLAKVLDMPLRYFDRVRLDIGGIVRVELSLGKSEVISVNETWHLRTCCRSSEYFEERAGSYRNGN